MADSRSPESYTEREKWDSLDFPGRIRYLFDYYKLPIIVLCFILYLAGYAVYRHVTHKDAVLYTALINVAAGEDLTRQLSEPFPEYLGLDPSKNAVTLYSGWYLTDNPDNEYYEYTYATRMKVLASIDAQQLDVVLMNQEAFDAFAQNGYLCDLDEFLGEMDPELLRELEPCLVKNLEILEDNAEDVLMDPSVQYVSSTREYRMGIDLSGTELMKEAGFPDAVYLGILGNTPRKETAVQYLKYLFSIE